MDEWREGKRNTGTQTGPSVIRFIPHTVGVRGKVEGEGEGGRETRERKRNLVQVQATSTNSLKWTSISYHTPLEFSLQRKV